MRLRICFLALSMVFSTGCKIKILVPEEGLVETISEVYMCNPGTSCQIDVVDTFFDETFIATPSDGYVFAYWKKRDGALCAGSQPNPCRLFTSFFNSFPLLMSFLESDKVFYIEPTFRRDLAGEWSIVVKENATDCEEGIILHPPETMIIEQSGQDLFFTGSSSYPDLPANLSQDSVSWDYVYPEDEGSTRGIGQLSLSEDGNELIGQENWEYSERGYSCEGYDEITLTRL